MTKNCLRFLFLFLGAACFANACSDEEIVPGHQSGTETNWLKACTVESDCTGVAHCICGLCTILCESDSECAAAPTGVSCARDPARLSVTCGSFVPPDGVCLPSGGNQDGGSTQPDGSTTGGAGGADGSGGAAGANAGSDGAPGSGGAAAGAGGNAGSSGSSGSGGSSGTAGAGGGAGGSSAGAAGTLGAGGATAGGGAGNEPGVRCGSDVCNSPAERCLSDWSGGMHLGVSCEPASSGCTQGGGCVILECDGPEDCEAGEVCRFSLSESNYLVCAPEGGNYGLPCASEADCSAQYPVCSGIATAEEQLLLGWSPAVCLEF